jgi:hypothetical protein
VNIYFCRGLSENSPKRPICHDYIERNEISKPLMKKKHLEGSGSHQNKGEAEWGHGQDAHPNRWGHLPFPCPIRAKLVDYA